MANEMIKNNFGYFEIDIFGDYVELEYKNKITKLIKDYNLEKNIFLKGFREVQKIPFSNFFCLLFEEVTFFFVTFVLGFFLVFFFATFFLLIAIT